MYILLLICIYILYIYILYIYITCVNIIWKNKQTKLNMVYDSEMVVFCLRRIVENASYKLTERDGSCYYIFQRDIYYYLAYPTVVHFFGMIF